MMKKWTNKVILGDCREVMKQLPENSIDAVVTDPPYELGFMNKKWDKTGIAYDVDMWRECFRVLKPGGYLLAFAGTRTYHRIACAIEDAGFIIHPFIGWIFGNGFPKTTSLSLQFDQQTCREELTKKLGRKPTKEEFEEAWDGFREIVSETITKSGGMAHVTKANKEQGYRQKDYYQEKGNVIRITSPATPEAQQWEGWHYGLQSLKPAIEPICMAQKSIEGERMTDNILKWGIGAINVDRCRIGTDEITTHGGGGVTGGTYNWANTDRQHIGTKHRGRFPANVIFDEAAAGLLDVQSGISKSARSMRGIGYSDSNVYGSGNKAFDTERGHNDTGGASRFFYVAKASKKERTCGG